MRVIVLVFVLIALAACSNDPAPSPTPAPLYSPGEATAVVQTWLSGQTVYTQTCLWYIEGGRGRFVEEMVSEGKWEVRYTSQRTVGSDKAGTLWVRQVFEGTNAVSRVTSGEEC
jgi:hypothetical protein